jgi:hypothetical protein
MTRGRRAALAGIAVVAIVAAAVGGYSLYAGLTGSGASGSDPAIPHFVDETAAAGISHTYDGGIEYSTGGGVAVFDCDGDGKPDIYLAGGANPAVLYRNQSPVGGSLKFTAVPSAATDLTGVTGAYPVDIDSDGVTDLVVLRAGETELLRGLGKCAFERANDAWGIDGGNTLTEAFSATWEAGNTWPTLAFGRYVGLKPGGGVTQDCEPNWLVRPGAGGKYAAPITLDPAYCPLSMLFSSWDGSGRADLRLANDRHYYIGGQEQLWRVAPGEAPRAYTAAEGWQPLQLNGMGIAGYDLTGDGLPEYLLTSQADDKLQTLANGPSQPNFKDIALARGVTASRPATGGDVLPSTSWHPEWQDVNNDGRVDLLITKGNVSGEPDFASKDPSDLFLQRPDGTFAEAVEQAGIVDFDRGRGAALADFNLDGQLDLVEVFYGGAAKIWRSAGAGDATAAKPMGHWAAIRVTEPAPNTDAIGAVVEWQVGGVTQQRELVVGGGHASGEIGWIHLGLGDATSAQVRVHWPDGTVGPWLAVTADAFSLVTKGATSAAPWQPPAN